MTKKDLFIILIKIFGLYFLISSLFSVLPGNIAYILSNIDLIGLVWILFTILIGIGLLILLLFKAEKIISILKLDKGFDSDEINFKEVSTLIVIKFSILIVGGFLFVENIPTFLSYTLFAFKSSIPQGFDQAYANTDLIKYTNISDYIRWGSSALNLIIGFLLISNFKSISVFLDEKVKE